MFTRNPSELAQALIARPPTGDEQSMSSYDPTLRERISNWLMGDRPSPERQHIVSGLIGSSTSPGLIDATPAGIPLYGQEAARRGDPQEMAMAIMPGAHNTEELAAPFYSKLEHLVHAVPFEKAHPQQWFGTLMNAGVKPAELNWTGFEDWLKGQQGPVTKSQAVDYLKNNKVDLQEVIKDKQASGYNSPLTLQGVIDEHPNEVNTLRRHGYQLEMNNIGELYARHRNGELHDLFDISERQNTPTDLADAAQTVIENYTPPEFLNDDIEYGQHDVRHKQYTLPGGENYREFVLHLPPRETNSRYRELNQKLARGEMLTSDEYKELGQLDAEPDTRPVDFQAFGHWEEPNPVVHVRTTDRTINGKKTLLAEELQSDWGQQGRKKGWKDPNFVPYDFGNDPFISDTDVNGPHRFELWKKRMNLRAGDYPGHTRQWAGSSIDNLKSKYGSGVNAETRYPTPIDWDNIKTYPLDFVNKNLNIADAQGIARMPWPNSEDWASLGLKRMIKFAADNGYDQFAWAPGHVHGQRWGDEEARNHGLNDFYDKILPNIANKLGKKFGTRVSRESMETADPMRGLADHEDFSEDGGGVINVHTLPITDAMRSEARTKGFPLFNVAAPIAGAGLAAQILQNPDVLDQQ